jgi:hypothetical protein
MALLVFFPGAVLIFLFHPALYIAGWVVAIVVFLLGLFPGDKW